MLLRNGTQLGPYEILAPLGAGGMGEVYRARDPRLDRDVAVKVLPAAFAEDADRLRRFEHEARAAAAITHPNILAVHDIGQYAFESPGAERTVPYIVSDLLEGMTLEELLTRGALPMRKAVDFAIQIANGLAAAHAEGIVHRDLKPANVLVTSDDRATILDFGLARLVRPERAVAEAGSPQTTLQTKPGVVLGTVGYMAPEQVRGQLADERSDLFAVGVILYEMLTGQPAFRGDTAADTMAAIVNLDPPDLTGSGHAVSPALARIVTRCLEKAPAARFQNASDLAFALEGVTHGADSAAARTVAPSRSWGSALAWAATTAVLALGAFAAVHYLRPGPSESSAVHSTITPPVDIGVFSIAPPLALSPDGRYLAFTATDDSEGAMLWLTRLDRPPNAEPIAGTEGAEAPFWSPDSRFVGFVADGALKKVEVDGGPIVTLTTPATRVPGSWNDDDVILFRPSATEGLSRVSAAGGPVARVTTVDEARGELSHSYPHFLPDGRFLYIADTGNGAPDLYLAALDSPGQALLLEDVSNAQHAGDALLFVRGTTLMARPFDADRGSFTGGPVPIADQLQTSTLGLTTGVWPAGAFSISDTGVLVYLRSASADSELVWFNRSGERTGVLGDPGSYADVFLSPDGSKASVSLLDPNGTGTRDIWAYDVVRGIRTRLTFDPGDEFEGIWSPDGDRIVFNSTRMGGRDLYRKPARGGAGTQEPLLEDAFDKYAQDWSLDGQSLLYITSGAGGNQDIRVLSLAGDRATRPYLATPYGEGVGAGFSPDGNWVSYTSNESGRQEAYIARFPEHADREQISTNGGLLVTWREDGREVYYFEPATSRIMAVELSYDSTGITAAPPRPIVTVEVGGPRSFYDVTPDGQRFLVNSVLDRTAAPPITLIVNWPSLLDPSR